MALKVKPANSVSNELNFIGTGTTLEGLIETNGSLRIDGKIKGTVKSNDSVTIGSGGEVLGDVFARNVILGGKVEGNVVVEEKLILESTSILIGNIRAAKLIIDEGALFNGKSEMGDSGARPEKKKFTLTANTPVVEAGETGEKGTQ